MSSGTSRLLGTLPAVVASTVVAMFLLGLPENAAGQLAPGTLSIAYSEATRSWNPVNYDSYTGRFVTHLTTERLFEPACYGGGETAVGGTDANLFRFELACQAQHHSYVEEQGMILFEPRAGVCPGLTSGDLDFSVNRLINHVASDSVYKLFRLSYTAGQRGGGDLRTGLYSRGTPRNQAFRHFTFPILRTRNIDLAGFDPAEFLGNEFRDPGTVRLYNSLNCGNFAVESQTTFQRTLVERDRVSCRPKAEGSGPLRRIQMNNQGRFEDLLTEMTGQAPPEVVLSWVDNQEFFRRTGSYDRELPLYSESFTYAGFNYGTSIRENGRLMRSEEFRRLFTRTLWRIRALRSMIQFTGGRTATKPGIFIGQSFDPGQRQEADVPPSEEDLRREIETFLAGQPALRTRFRFKILVSPFFARLFDPADLGNLEDSLGELWRRPGSDPEAPGIDFKLVTDAVEFERLRGEGDYDMILTRLIWEDPMEVIDLVTPGNSRNYLGVDTGVFQSSELDGYRRQGVTGVAAFLRAFSERFPVAVIGHFPRRDLILSSIRRAPATCRQGTVPYPFYGIEQWGLPGDP